MKTKTLIPLLGLVCLLATSAAAQINYAISGNTAYVTNSPSASGNVVIASTYNGYPVTSIGVGAFLNCLSLTNVTIPDSVTAIGSSAFNYSGLTSVTIPNSVTSLGLAVFYDCTWLRSVTIGNNVTNIGDYAFANTGVTSVTIPDSVTNIGYAAFGGCFGLRSATIGKSVTGIGIGAFSSCHSLTNVTIPDTVISIGESAFFDCTGLSSVTIGNGVTIIGDFAFQHSGLTNITFLGNAPSGGRDMFTFIDTGAKVYYYYGATGWWPYYGGLPTVMLGAPAPQVGVGSAGVKAGGFGFTLNGVVNQTIVVEATTNLVNWQPIWTRTLSTLSTNFVDPDWVNFPHRFYRLRSN